jgi:hypothetical protein
MCFADMVVKPALEILSVVFRPLSVPQIIAFLVISSDIYPRLMVNSFVSWSNSKENRGPLPLGEYSPVNIGKPIVNG